MSAQRIVRGTAAVMALVLVGGQGLLAQGRGGERMATPSAAPGDYDENGQAKRLPSLPQGMTLAMIRQGDSLFHGAGGCLSCHGQDAQGVRAMGSALTSGLNFIPIEWRAIDSLITAGMPEPLTRTPIAMPPRGAQSNLTADQIRLVAAYVWAISQVQDEPWEGGHRTHAAPAPANAAPKR